MSNEPARRWTFLEPAARPSDSTSRERRRQATEPNESSSDRARARRSSRRIGLDRHGGLFARLALASLFVLGVASNRARASERSLVTSERGDEDPPESTDGQTSSSPPTSPTRMPTSTRHPRRGPIVAFEAHLSLLSDVADRSLLASAFGYALSVTARVGDDWLVGAKVEHDVWSTFELEGGLDLGALSIAMVVAKLHLDGRVRTTVSAGPSVLLFDTGLDRRGNVGLYLELRPLGVRWSRPRATVVLDPLTFAVVAPVLTNIPLVQIQYRTVLQIEIGGGR